MSSESSSASPEPPLTALKSKPKDKKGKKKAASGSKAAGRGRNEGVDPTWAYKPPSGVVLLDTVSNEAQDAGEFDWDAVANNPELELWLIRVPDAVKPRTLENAIVALPASSSESAHVGTIHRKHVSFDVWSIGDDDNEHVSGEEIKSISCLLPKNGTLYPSPKPIARHLVVAAQAVTPTRNSNTAAPPSSSHKNPPRQCYPKDLLKHRFLPIGALAEDVNTTDVDVDMEMQPPEPEQALVPSDPGLTQTPKKQKKTKEKVAKADMDVDAGADRLPEALELEPTPTPTQTQAKHKKEKKNKKGTESLSQVEAQAGSTPVKVKTKKRKSLEDGETLVATTPKKAKRAKLSTPLPA